MLNGLSSHLNLRYVILHTEAHFVNTVAFNTFACKLPYKTKYYENMVSWIRINKFLRGYHEYFIRKQIDLSLISSLEAYGWSLFFSTCT